MKIFILNIDAAVQPKHQGFAYPSHSSDYGVEQDFLQFLMTHRSLLTYSHEDADWYYLPVYWTRWHLNHNFAREGVEELQHYVDAAVVDDSRTFTVCQYDDGPLVSLGRSIQFLASRKTVYGKDIPLLCDHHRKPFIKPAKKYRASFVGNLSTHSLRDEMAGALKVREDIVIRNANIGTKAYVKMLLQSRLALAPRGYGGSSFRLFEAMQLGVAPVLIGDLDTRPFKHFLPWHEASIYVDSIENLLAVLDNTTEDEMIEMGIRAEKLYRNHLTYQKWCPYVLKELKRLYDTIER